MLNLDPFEACIGLAMVFTFLAGYLLRHSLSRELEGIAYTTGKRDALKDLYETIQEMQHDPA